MVFNDSLRAYILDRASALNFYAKRINSSRLIVACEIVEGLEAEYNASGVDPEALIVWLADNKPAKPAKTAKPAPVAFTGSAEAEDLPVIAGSTFLLTSAQNNTEVNGACFDELKLIADRHNAEILAIPLRYKKQGYAYEEDQIEYDARIEPYLIAGSCWLGDRGSIKLLADQILITQKMPINGVADLNNGEAVTIAGHTKQQLKTLPRSAHDLRRWAYTTGSVTKLNYSDSRAGATASASHVYGGLLVRITDQGVTMINLVYAKGAIQYYDPERGEVWGDRPSLVLGDIHAETAGKYEIDLMLNFVESLQPEAVAIHDLLDFNSNNHHNAHSFSYSYKQRDRGVVDDFKDAGSILTRIADRAPDTAIKVVASNHDNMADRWIDLRGYEPRPKDAISYYSLKLAQLKAGDQGINFIALEEAIKDQIEGLNIEFLRLGSSHKFNGIVISEHGHRGMSGGRGLLIKTLVPLVQGHSHAPQLISQRFAVVGLSGSLTMDYATGGLSLWDRCNAIIHTNGAIQMQPLEAIKLA